MDKGGKASIVERVNQRPYLTRRHSHFQLPIKFYRTSFSEVKFHIQMTLLWIICVDTDITDQLLIIYCAFFKYLRKNENGVSNKSLWFSTKVILYNILIKFGIHTKLLQLIKYVEIKPTVKYGHANFYLMCFLLRMIQNEMLYYHCFSTLL